MNSFFEPFKDSLIFKFLFAIVLFFVSWLSNAQGDQKSELFKTLKAKDSIIFERSFNLCEIEKLEPIIAKNFEFYHDVTGIQDRQKFMNALEENVCSNFGKFQRNLVENSLEVYSLKNNGVLYGAIQKGKHTFHKKQKKTFKTVGIADFTHVWILENKQWKLKRVLSYNHQSYTE